MAGNKDAVVDLDRCRLSSSLDYLTRIASFLCARRKIHVYQQLKRCVRNTVHACKVGTAKKAGAGANCQKVSLQILYYCDLLLH